MVTGRCHVVVVGGDNRISWKEGDISPGYCGQQLERRLNLEGGKGEGWKGGRGGRGEGVEGEKGGRG